MTKAKNLKPGDKVILGFNHPATVKAVTKAGGVIVVTWEEPYMPYRYPPNQEVRDA